MARQRRIEGTYDKPPVALQDVLDTFIKNKRLHQKYQTATKEAKEVLIEKMIELDWHDLEIDDGEKVLHLLDDHKLKIEAKKKSNPEANAAEVVEDAAY